MKTLSDSKQTAYRKARQRLEPIISRKIDSLALDDLQEVVNSEATSHYTARDMKSLLSHLYQRAMAGGGATGSITVNLARMIVLPELKEDEPEPFTAEGVSAVWKAWDGGDLFAGYILLMIYSSMMPGELLNCKAAALYTQAHLIGSCLTGGVGIGSSLSPPLRTMRSSIAAMLATTAATKPMSAQTPAVALP